MVGTVHDGQVRIIAVEVPGGAPVFDADLPHGSDPHRIAWERGYRIIRPLSASGGGADVTLTVQVGLHRRSRALPRLGPRAVDADLDLGTLSVAPVVRQRVAAYALVLSERGLLATQFSARTAIPGLWGLPGGGIDAGESASAAVLREIEEETGQAAEISQLLDVQTDHWIGRSPSGVVEDFHAVRIIYAGRCPQPGTPVVNDVGGTTAAAAWIPLSEWTSHSWSAWARALLERHLTRLSAAG